MLPLLCFCVGHCSAALTIVTASLLIIIVIVLSHQLESVVSSTEWQAYWCLRVLVSRPIGIAGLFRRMHLYLGIVCVRVTASRPLTLRKLGAGTSAGASAGNVPKPLEKLLSVLSAPTFSSTLPRFDLS